MAVEAARVTSKPWIPRGIAALVVYAFAAASYHGKFMPGWIALLVLVGSGVVAASAPISSWSRLHSLNYGLPASFTEADGNLAETLDSLEGAVNYTAWIHEMASPYLGSRLLEVGAGHGTLTVLLARDGRTVVATELSERCVGKLAERFSHCSQVTVAHADFDQAASYGTFDTALLVNVLEHIEDDGRALRELRQVLEPGGRVVLWVPAHPSLYSPFDRLVGHYRRYRLKELRTALESAGFEVEQIRYVNAVGALAWWLAARFLRRNPTSGPGVKIFDRALVPVVRRVESVVRPPFGQSILAVGANLSNKPKLGAA
jgi:SAM-dependent methyltransferase